MKWNFIVFFFKRMSSFNFPFCLSTCTHTRARAFDANFCKVHRNSICVCVANDVIFELLPIGIANKLHTHRYWVSRPLRPSQWTETETKKKKTKRKCHLLLKRNPSAVVLHFISVSFPVLSPYPFGIQLWSGFHSIVVFFFTRSSSRLFTMPFDSYSLGCIVQSRNKAGWLKWERLSFR